MLARDSFCGGFRGQGFTLGLGFIWSLGDALEVLFWKVCAQLLWENGARVLVDFSPGAGMLSKTALSLGIKVVCVALNDAHKSCLNRLLHSYIRGNVEADVPGFVPADKASKIDELKPKRLAVYEKQSGREGQPPLPGAGRQNFEKNVLSALDALQSGAPPAKKQKVAVPKAKEPPPQQVVPKSEQPTAPPKAKATPKAGPSESVADLLKAWGAGK